MSWSSKRTRSRLPYQPLPKTFSAILGLHRSLTCLTPVLALTRMILWQLMTRYLLYSSFPSKGAYFNIGRKTIELRSPNSSPFPDSMLCSTRTTRSPTVAPAYRVQALDRSAAGIRRTKRARRRRRRGRGADLARGRGADPVPARGAGPALGREAERAWA